MLPSTTASRRLLSLRCVTLPLSLTPPSVIVQADVAGAANHAVPLPSDQRGQLLSVSITSVGTVSVTEAGFEMLMAGTADPQGTNTAQFDSCSACVSSQISAKRFAVQLPSEGLCLSVKVVVNEISADLNESLGPLLDRCFHTWVGHGISTVTTECTALENARVYRLFPCSKMQLVNFGPPNSTKIAYLIKLEAVINICISSCLISLPVLQVCKHSTLPSWPVDTPVNLTSTERTSICSATLALLQHCQRAYPLCFDPDYVERVERANAFSSSIICSLSSILCSTGNSQLLQEATISAEVLARHFGMLELDDRSPVENLPSTLSLRILELLRVQCSRPPKMPATDMTYLLTGQNQPYTPSVSLISGRSSPFYDCLQKSEVETDSAIANKPLNELLWLDEELFCDNDNWWESISNDIISLDGYDSDGDHEQDDIVDEEWENFLSNNSATALSAHSQFNFTDSGVESIIDKTEQEVCSIKRSLVVDDIFDTLSIDAQLSGDDIHSDSSDMTNLFNSDHGESEPDEVDDLIARTLATRQRRMVIFQNQLSLDERFGPKRQRTISPMLSIDSDIWPS